MKIKHVPIIAKPVSFRVRFGGKTHKVILRDGEIYEFKHHEFTDEGYDAQLTLLVREGNMLYSTHYYRSRDCDGPHSSTYEYECHVSERFARRGRPNWKCLNYQQRDYFAESMGY